MLAILVRPGNPRKITGVRNPLAPGLKVLVVNGAGQNGVWEDMAGRGGNIRSARSLRRNIVAHTKNSAEARQTWIERPDIDAWLIWNIWQVSNPKLADPVNIESGYAIYRDTGVVVTKLARRAGQRNALSTSSLRRMEPPSSASGDGSVDAAPLSANAWRLSTRKARGTANERVATGPALPW